MTPSRANVADRLVEDGAVRGIDAGERLVEEHDQRVLHEGAGEEDALLLAAGELADVAVAHAAEAEAVERLGGALAVGRSRRGAASHRAGSAP